MRCNLADYSNRQSGSREGMSPDEFFQKNHIIGTGMIVPTASAMLGKFVSLGGKYDILESTEEICRIKWLWKDREITTEFTIEQAKETIVIIGINGDIQYANPVGEELFESVLDKSMKGKI